MEYGRWSPRGIWISAATLFFFFFAPLHLGGTEGRRCTEEQHILNFARTTTPAGQYLTPNLHGVRRLPTKLSSPSLGPWGVSAARASQCRSKWKKLACIGFPSGGAKRSMSRVLRTCTCSTGQARSLAHMAPYPFLCSHCPLPGWGGVVWCRWIDGCVDGWVGACCVLLLLRYHRGSEENVQRYLGGFGQPPPPANYS